ncbi:DUF707 domain-containing protein [Asticcacaulis tiandongensis]|uniref:DUF707 domain-containing protein n=1 Tax=Asticcacaulis tiandongensis TaxID=2565365 RepID=UPI00112C78EE|nr:DUF707 domain-containing protein [Asticcacaulis tiandongensis]
MRSVTKSSRRFLVLGRVGDSSLHKHWLEGLAASDRTWDLVLNAFGKDSERVQDGDLPTVFDYGTKWDSIVRYFKANPHLFDQYDYVMFPDDDVLMNAADINRVFEITSTCGLTMAQPSLTHDCYFTFPVLLSDPQFSYRYTSYIESMACCMKSSYFRTLIPMFERHYTGWGTDQIWTMLMDAPAYKAAIIDEVRMVHTRPLYTGPLYKSYSQGIDPRQELIILTQSFTNLPKGMHIYGGVLKNGRHINATETRLRFVLNLVKLAFRTHCPIFILRAALVMFLRIFTHAKYKPETLKVRPGSAIDLIRSEATKT